MKSSVSFSLSQNVTSSSRKDILSLFYAFDSAALPTPSVSATS